MNDLLLICFSVILCMMPLIGRSILPLLHDLNDILESELKEREKTWEN